MEGLRHDQFELLAWHRERAFDVLLAASAAYKATAPLGETPEGTELLRQTRDLQVSIAVSAAAAATERRRLQKEQVESERVLRIEASDVFPAQVLDLLRRRRLPFEPADVELMLDLATSTIRPDDAWGHSFETMHFAVAAAANVLRVQPGAPPVVGALERAVAAIGQLELTSWRGTRNLPRRIRSLVAENLPGGVLDLSLADARDAWAEQARTVLRAHAARWDGVPELLALLASASGNRPSKTWRRQATALAARYDGFGEMLRELLEPILTIEVTTSGAWPPAWLLAPDNEALAKGATWAAVEVDEPWVVPLLGRLAVRGAEPSPHPSVTAALAHSLASGAVEALVLIGTPAAHDSLRTLLGEIGRRDVRKRIAAIVGEPGDDARRRLPRRGADPGPREGQRAASAYVRSELTGALRAAGFDDSTGGTFWRDLEDRVEVVQSKPHRGGLTLELGLWFVFMPRRETVGERGGRPRPPQFACDIRGRVHAWHDDLGSAAGKAERWFGRWRPLPVVVRWLQDGDRSEEAQVSGVPGSPFVALLAGYVAREIGDLETAREELGRAVALHREKLESDRHSAPDEATPERQAWVERIESDAADL